jgi:hypothetical protein
MHWPITCQFPLVCGEGNDFWLQESICIGAVHLGGTTLNRTKHYLLLATKSLHFPYFVNWIGNYSC